MAAKASGYQAALDMAVEALEAELYRIARETKRIQGILAVLKAGGNVRPSEFKLSKPIPVQKAIDTAKALKPKKAQRTRRSSEDVTKQAVEMVAFIKSKGKAGVAGKEITAKFGPVLPSIKAFINGRVDAGSKIRTKGAASKTMYFA